MSSSKYHADLWIYASTKAGEAGSPGMQTYNRSSGVTDAENEELSKLSVFGSSLAHEDRLEMRRIWGLLPLRSSSRSAMFQISPAVDWSRRPTYMIKALIADKAAHWDALGQPPACYCGAPVLTEVLTEAQIAATEAPARRLGSVKLADLKPGPDYSGEDLDKALSHYSLQSDFAPESLLRAALGEPSRFIVSGNELEILTAFSLAWAAASHSDRSSLGFVTWWPDHVPLSASLLGWPSELGRPSAGYLAVVNRTFRWNRSKDAAYSPTELDLAKLVRASNKPLQDVLKRSKSWRTSRFGSASLRPLLNDTALEIDTLLEQRGALMAELQSLARQPAMISPAEKLRFVELLRHPGFVSGTEEENVRQVLLPLASAVSNSDAVVEIVWHRVTTLFQESVAACKRQLQSSVIGPLSDSSPAPSFTISWAMIFYWIEQCPDADVFCKRLVHHARSEAGEVTLEAQLQTFFTSALLAWLDSRPGVFLRFHEAGRDESIERGAGLLMDPRYQPYLRTAFCELAAACPGASVGLMSSWYNAGVARQQPLLAETVEMIGHWARHLVTGGQSSRPLEEMGQKIFLLPLPVLRLFLVQWFLAIREYRTAARRDWQYLLPILRSGSGYGSLVGEVLLEAFRSGSTDEIDDWLAAVPWVEQFETEARRRYFEELEFLMRETSPTKWIGYNVKMTTSNLVWLSRSKEIQKYDYAVAGLVTITVLASEDPAYAYFYCGLSFREMDSSWSRELHQALLFASLHRLKTAREFYSLGVRLLSYFKIVISEPFLDAVISRFDSKEQREWFQKVCASSEVRCLLKKTDYASRPAEVRADGRTGHRGFVSWLKQALRELMADLSHPGSESKKKTLTVQTTNSDPVVSFFCVAVPAVTFAVLVGIFLSEDYIQGINLRDFVMLVVLPTLIVSCVFLLVCSLVFGSRR